jgi:hypothetical protein
MIRSSVWFRRVLRVALAWVGCVLPPAGARADPVLLDFNGLTPGSGNAAVQAYLQGVVNTAHPGGVITVTGAAAEAAYNGENHVVGPIVNGSPVSLTLGRSQGGVLTSSLNTFLVNSGSTTITMKFSFPVYGVLFDYEIFPNGEIPDGTQVSPANYPDFTFKADGTQVFRTLPCCRRRRHVRALPRQRAEPTGAGPAVSRL